MSTDLIKRLRDALSDVTHKEFTKLIAEADAHLFSVGQSREAWIVEANAQFDAALTAYRNALKKPIEASKFYDITKKFDAHLRAVPDTPGMVPVEPVA